MCAVVRPGTLVEKATEEDEDDGEHTEKIGM
jgi:hypothetical protein